MKDTNKLVFGVAITFTVISAIAIYFNGSTIVSILSSLVAVASSLAYKYKCERDNVIEFSDVLLTKKDSQIERLEKCLSTEYPSQELIIDDLKSQVKRHLTTVREYEILLQKLSDDEQIAKDRLTIVKKPRQSKTRVKTELA